MKNRRLKRSSSGQVIVITALMVALVLLSTAIFVVETEKDVPTGGADANDVYSAYQQAARSTLISALANVTNGGNPAVLTADFNELDSLITSHSYQSILLMNFTPLNEAPYVNGVWISWGTNGQGISSAYVTLDFNSTGTSTTSSLECPVDITSQANLSGSCLQLNATLYQVNLTVNMLNEGKPALAQNFAFYYEDAALSAGNWTQVTSPIITDFGNGTYAVSFDAQVQQPGDPLAVSMRCEDQRGILVCANVTCANSG
ncbi:MAG TPA: hypothetical protein VK536_09765 [Candidatus Limnocylindrales bacterium]|nr:hypothetical protein [Candidatus Limnocylindrales bacterium]